MTPPTFSQLFHEVINAAADVAADLSAAAITEVQDHPVRTALTLASVFIAPAQPAIGLSLA